MHAYSLNSQKGIFSDGNVTEGVVCHGCFDRSGNSFQFLVVFDQELYETS